MLPCCNQHLAQFLQPWAVHLEAVDGSASCWSEAYDKLKVVLPLEVLFPDILPGVKKRCCQLGQGVFPMRVDRFVAVAALTGEGKILQRCDTTLRQWDDVLHAERVVRERDWHPAVFAAAACSLLNGQFPEFSHRVQGAGVCLGQTLLAEPRPCEVWTVQTDSPAFLH